ncbi:MAG TPA: pentapeptide repeat-containing protein [Leptolyngbyaceae cyanobacterium]
MQESISTKVTIESLNKYPDCVSLQLEAILVQSGADDAQQFDLYLTINFYEHWEPLLNGRVKLGLKGGELRLNLENGEITLASEELSGSWALAIEDRKVDEKSSNTENINGEKIIQETNNLQSSYCQIFRADSQSNHVWIFQVKTGESVLKGSLKSKKLGTVTVTGKPSRIQASFAIKSADLSVTDAEGLWRHDIHPNQHAVLERKLALFLWEAKLKSALSRVQLCYECGPINREKEAVGNLSLAALDLPNLIQKITTSPIHDLLELAKMAEFNPLTDFAGGNLRGTTLDEIDLSNANLCRTNLRGVQLCDAELTDANLSGANLGGADLSGADLGNANLSNTDLHKASLALANLSGANLSNADLREANFSNTNLGGAKVMEARFGKNVGITEEIKVSLMERGAIFEEP